MLEVTEAELDRLAVREIRYDRVDVTDALAAEAAAASTASFTFTAKPENFAPTPPPGAVILAAYARAVEAAFEHLGPTSSTRSARPPAPIRSRWSRPCWSGTRSHRQPARLVDRHQERVPFQCCAQAPSSRIAGRSALPFSVSA